jgi:hypothetical protein
MADLVLRVTPRGMPTSHPLFQRYTFDVGISLIVEEDDSVREVQYPSHDEILDAQFYFGGGRTHLDIPEEAVTAILDSAFADYLINVTPPAPAITAFPGAFYPGQVYPGVS